MSHWARPGAECVCVRAEWKRGGGWSLLAWLRLVYLGPPVQGATYVVTKTGTHRTNGEAYITLKGFGDAWFHIANFRPLIKDLYEQDVELFAPLLDPSHPKIADDVPKVPA